MKVYACGAFKIYKNKPQPCIRLWKVVNWISIWIPLNLYKWKMHSWERRIGYLLFYAAEFRPSLMIKILRSNSISNGLGSKYNTSGLNILRWKMTPRNFILCSHYKSIEYVWRGIKTISRPQKLYRAWTVVPPVLKFLDPPLERERGGRGLWFVCF